MEISHFEPFIVRVLISFCVLFAVSWVNDDKKNECCQEYCYNLDHKRPQQAYFSSKTSYFIAKRSHTNEQFAVPSKFGQRFAFFCKLVMGSCMQDKMFSFKQIDTHPLKIIYFQTVMQRRYGFMLDMALDCPKVLILIR